MGILQFFLRILTGMKTPKHNCFEHVLLSEEDKRELIQIIKNQGPVDVECFCSVCSKRVIIRCDYNEKK